jgi:hypothetical protein
MAKDAFETKPLIVAALIGGIGLFLLSEILDNAGATTTTANTILLGAITGLGVQVGVRLLGVS